MSRFIVGVIGAGNATERDEDNARRLGELIAREGWALLSGGRNVGVMQAASEGAKRVAGSLTIGILPMAADDEGSVSEDVDVAIFTGMGQARNNINVLSSHVVVACGASGAGTVSEIALALKAQKPVILLTDDEAACAFFVKLGGEMVSVADTPAAVVEKIRAIFPGSFLSMSDADKESEGSAPPAGDMSAEDFRRYGRQLVDWISDYFERIEQFPVLSQIAPGDLISQLPAEPPAAGEAFAEILRDLDRLIVPAVTHWSHPSFFAYFSTSTSAPGIFGEMLSAAFDMKAMLWRTSPASTELEEVTLSWLRQLMNLPEEFAGIIYDTASVSSMHAIAAAREQLNLRIREDGMSGRDDLPLLRVYVSEQAHSSIEKAVIALGLGQRSLCKVSTDAEFRMDAEALDSAIEADKAAGALPFCVVATFGTTSTSSVDPVSAIADLCERHGLWLHVDAAYAGSALLLPEMRELMRGCERADSLVTNPHKWLFTPFDLSVLYCRRMDILRRAFSLIPEYLRTSEPETVRNGMDYGIQLGRRFRALKLWMILRYFGQDGLTSRIREHCRLARLFANWVEHSTDWELLAPVPFSLVCFRARPAAENENPNAYAQHLDALNEALMNNVNRSGAAYLSHTRLNERFTLRLAIGNIRTTERHVHSIWELLNEELARLSSSEGRTS